jgi:hypothetical protein
MESIKIMVPVQSTRRDKPHPGPARGCADRLLPSDTCVPVRSRAHDHKDPDRTGPRAPPSDLRVLCLRRASGSPQDAHDSSRQTHVDPSQRAPTNVPLALVSSPTMPRFLSYSNLAVYVALAAAAPIPYVCLRACLVESLPLSSVDFSGITVYSTVVTTLSGATTVRTFGSGAASAVDAITTPTAIVATPNESTTVRTFGSGVASTVHAITAPTASVATPSEEITVRTACSTVSARLCAGQASRGLPISVALIERAYNPQNAQTIHDCGSCQTVWYGGGKTNKPVHGSSDPNTPDKYATVPSATLRSNRFEPRQTACTRFGTDVTPETIISNRLLRTVRFAFKCVRNRTA